jgi:hypothetical protein
LRLEEHLAVVDRAVSPSRPLEASKAVTSANTGLASEKAAVVRFRQ